VTLRQGDRRCSGDHEERSERRPRNRMHQSEIPMMTGTNFIAVPGVATCM
jgi:hypothetical protein